MHSASLAAIVLLVTTMISHLGHDEKALRKICIALAVYLTSLFAANTLGLKIMPFLPLPSLFEANTLGLKIMQFLRGSHISVAVFSFPFVFLTTDVIGEVFGKPTAKMFVLAGFCSTLLFMGYSILSLVVPWASDGLWAQKSYDQMFSISLRMGLASLTAFLIAEYQDVVAFFFFRKLLGRRHFWLRSLFSNLWSQLLDTTIFMVIAFAGVYETQTLISLIVTWWLYKVGMGALYTPLSYIGIWLLRKEPTPT